ncbi:HAD family hydrolase [Actinopolymorpha alba]|uniref:HAD family hydrolase n=1 Tax=Actinopolymorpha alba TaxID=533267 RepID=UPI00037B2162|nr:HAD family hydrolase [Actinopolymorpha alba]
MTVDAVIFDWGGTLTPWHTVDLTEQWRAYARAYDPGHGEEVAAALLAAENAAWRLARDEHTSTAFETVVRAAGLDPTGLPHERGLAAFQAFWEPHTYTEPDVIPLLEALRERGVAVGVLSNTVWPRDYHEMVFARDKVLHLIDGAVYTSEIAWTKPHPEAFAAAMTAVRMADPSRCVFVGDRLFDDVYGAKSVGMRAVHIPHSDIPADQIGHTVGEPDAVINRLAELLPLVDQWRSVAS